MVLVTLVVFTSFETRNRIEMFREACQIWPCHIITNNPIHANISYIREHVVTIPCNESGHSSYMLGNLRYMLGYRSMQADILEDWILLVDDDTRVFPHRSDFLEPLNSQEMILMGDFGNQGQLRFACGGGGFLFSRVAFLKIDFGKCFAAQHCTWSHRNWAVDHMLAKCLKPWTNLTLDTSFNCGTCSNVWSAHYTTERLISTKCKFMHNQRSHSPRRYREHVYKHLPLTVHRWHEFFV